METTKTRKPRAWTLRALLLVLVAIGFLSLAGPPVTRAARANVDSWSGHNEFLTTVNTAYTANTAATVFTGVSGRILNVRAMTFSTSAAGFLVFKDHASGNIIGQFYCAATTQYQVTEDLLGIGMQTTVAGGAIDMFVTVSGTVCITARISKQ